MIKKRDQQKDGVGVKEEVVVTWSEKNAYREQTRKDSLIKCAKESRANCKCGSQKYLEQYMIDQKTDEMKKLSSFLRRDYKQIDIDGINVLLSSENEMSDEDIISKYKE